MTGLSLVDSTVHQLEARANAHVHAACMTFACVRCPGAAGENLCSMHSSSCDTYSSSPKQRGPARRTCAHVALTSHVQCRYELRAHLTKNSRLAHGSAGLAGALGGSLRGGGGERGGHRGSGGWLSAAAGGDGSRVPAVAPTVAPQHHTTAPSVAPISSRLPVGDHALHLVPQRRQVLLRQQRKGRLARPLGSSALSLVLVVALWEK